MVDTCPNITKELNHQSDRLKTIDNTIDGISKLGVTDSTSDTLTILSLASDGMKNLITEPSHTSADSLIKLNDGINAVDAKLRETISELNLTKNDEKT